MLLFVLSMNICIYFQIEILCNDEILGKHHTLKFVAVTRWRVKVRSFTTTLAEFTCSLELIEVALPGIVQLSLFISANQVHCDINMRMCSQLVYKYVEGIFARSLWPCAVDGLVITDGIPITASSECADITACISNSFSESFNICVFAQIF